MTNQYAGNCKWCGHTVEAGKGVYERGHGPLRVVRHRRCSESSHRMTQTEIVVANRATEESQDWAKEERRIEMGAREILSPRSQSRYSRESGNMNRTIR
jgi:ribosomal protein L24E